MNGVLHGSVTHDKDNILNKGLTFTVAQRLIG